MDGGGVRAGCMRIRCLSHRETCLGYLPQSEEERYMAKSHWMIVIELASLHIHCQGSSLWTLGEKWISLKHNVKLSLSFFRLVKNKMAMNIYGLKSTPKIKIEQPKQLSANFVKAAKHVENNVIGQELQIN
ncbi:unnamed protein product [Eruca vesicaria subsp. sativa]|uniref:Uncharacterized protein n=1 Tax=Eruca vesicaria subsp. sativa TaxID=29727 RepID=A0ABC8J203_ERUVS|nr:unnamed protein product [Eruca vesicaria subsp. sativa]